MTDGAVANPAAEQRLLDKAKLVALSDLRDEARKAKAAADADPEATAARIHADRFLRRWTDGEGAYNLALRTTAKAGADIDAALAPVIDQLFHEARKQGREEPAEAYAADALHRLVTTGGSDRNPGAGIQGDRPRLPRCLGAGPRGRRRDLRTGRHRARPGLDGARDAR